jgi:hypothetical protein
LWDSGSDLRSKAHLQFQTQGGVRNGSAFYCYTQYLLQDQIQIRGQIYD